MTPQWFLDLDGMKSGPYLTSEILGLMTEGKVLPHHRVSPTLEFGPWITVMDWRLQQAGSNAPPQFTTKTYPITPPVTPHLTPPTSVRSLPARSSEPPPVGPQSSSHSDPVAELFNLLQNSKQRRETKNATHSSNTGSGQMASTPQMFPTPSGPQVNEVAWASRGLVMSMILLGGFVAGQVFKMSSADGDKKIESNSPVKAVTTPPPPAPTLGTPSANLPSMATAEKKVVEKKIDKFTIRAEVPTKRQESDAAPGGSSVAKELEDLRAMKQELEDIKKLREELKSATKPNGESSAVEDYPDIEGYETLEAPFQTAPIDVNAPSDAQQPGGRSGPGWR